MHHVPTLMMLISYAWFRVAFVCGVILEPTVSWLYNAEDRRNPEVYQTHAGQPLDLAHVLFVSNNLGDLEVSWCSSQPDVVYSLRYTIEARYRFNLTDTTPVLKDGANSTCWKSVLKIGKSLCYLEIHARNAVSSRIVYSKAGNKSVEPREHIKPAVVQLLSHSTPTQTSVNITWNTPEGDMYVMDYKPVRLLYRVNYSSLWDNGSIVINQSTGAQLVSLQAATTYAVSVACKPLDSGYWSDAVWTNFETREAAPSVAPEIGPDFYLPETCSDEPDCYTTAFWKPLPERVRNGILKGYELVVINSRDVVVEAINRTSTFVRLKLNRSLKHTVHLRAFTDAGYSPVATIVIPENEFNNQNASERATASPVYAETSDNSGIIAVVWNSSVYSPTSVFYCVRDNGDTVDEHYPCDMQDVNYELVSRLNVDRLKLTGVRLTDGATVWYALSGSTYNVRNESVGLLGQWSRCVYDISLNALPSKPEISISVRGDARTSNTTTVVVVDRPSCEKEQPFVRVARYSLEITAADRGYYHQKNLSTNSNSYEVNECSQYHGSMNFTITLTAVSFRGKHGPQAVTFCYNEESDKRFMIVIAVVIAVVATLTGMIPSIIAVVKCRECLKRQRNNIKIKIPELTTTTKPVDADSFGDGRRDEVERSKTVPCALLEPRRRDNRTSSESIASWKSEGKSLLNASIDTYCHIGGFKSAEASSSNSNIANANDDENLWLNVRKPLKSANDEKNFDGSCDNGGQLSSLSITSTTSRYCDFDADLERPVDNERAASTDSDAEQYDSYVMTELIYKKFTALNGEPPILKYPPSDALVT